MRIPDSLAVEFRQVRHADLRSLEEGPVAERSDAGASGRSKLPAQRDVPVEIRQ